MTNSFSAFVWTEATGIMSLTDLLLVRGTDTAGFDAFTGATAISRNGRVILGGGQYLGCPTSFIVDLGTACLADLDGDGVPHAVSETS